MDCSILRGGGAKPYRYLEIIVCRPQWQQKKPAGDKYTVHLWREK